MSVTKKGGGSNPTCEISTPATRSWNGCWFLRLPSWSFCYDLPNISESPKSRVRHGPTEGFRGKQRSCPNAQVPHTKQEDIRSYPRATIIFLGGGFWQAPAGVLSDQDQPMSKATDQGNGILQSTAVKTPPADLRYCLHHEKAPLFFSAPPIGVIQNFDQNFFDFNFVVMWGIVQCTLPIYSASLIIYTSTVFFGYGRTEANNSTWKNSIPLHIFIYWYVFSKLSLISMHKGVLNTDRSADIGIALSSPKKNRTSNSFRGRAMSSYMHSEQNRWQP